MSKSKRELPSWRAVENERGPAESRSEPKALCSIQRIEKGVLDALKREAHRNKEARRNKWNLSREIEMRLEASLVDVSSKDRWGSTKTMLSDA